MQLPGAYTLKVSDVLGNTREMSFIVVKPLVQVFEHNFDGVPGVEKVTVDAVSYTHLLKTRSVLIWQRKLSCW